jgi:hypothetical protein
MPFAANQMHLFIAKYPAGISFVFHRYFLGNTAHFAFYNLRAVSPTMAHRPRWENAR